MTAAEGAICVHKAEGGFVVADASGWLPGVYPSDAMARAAAELSATDHTALQSWWDAYGPASARPVRDKVAEADEFTAADLALAKSLMNAGRAASYEAGALDIARHRLALAHTTASVEGEDIDRLRRAVYEDQPFTVISEALSKATGLPMGAPIPFDTALVTGMDDAGSQRVIRVILAALSSPAQPQRAASSQKEQRRLARLAFAIEMSQIDRDARLCELTDDEVDSIVDGVLAGARLTNDQPQRASGEVEEAALLDTLRDECWDLRCFDVPTGGDDADVAWRVVGHWQAEPREREIARAYDSDPRVALRAARSALKGERHGE